MHTVVDRVPYFSVACLVYGIEGSAEVHKALQQASGARVRLQAGWVLYSRQLNATATVRAQSHVDSKFVCFEMYIKPLSGVIPSYNM